MFSLHTNRLTLRLMSLDDLDFIATMLADPEVMRYYPKCYSREEAIHWIERQQRRYERHGTGFLLVEDKTSGQPIGQVGLLIQNILKRDEFEVGYLIHRPFWRRGYAFEASTACCDYAFSTLRANAYLRLVRPENLPSAGLARKLGMQPAKETIIHSTFVHNVFSISADDWRETPLTAACGLAL